MSEHGWIELVSIGVGGVIAGVVVLTGMKKGIGPQIRMALALCLICPILLALGLEKVLTSETIAALLGTVAGLGIPTVTGGGGSGHSSGSSTA